MAKVDPEALAKEFGYGEQEISSPSTNDYENLAKEFGYDPNYKKPVKPEQSFWQGLQNDPTLIGAVKRFGISTLRGAKDVIDTGAEGLAKVFGTEDEYNKVVKENREAREAFNKEYPPSNSIIPSASEAGRMTGQIAATIPIMPARAYAAIKSASGAIPTITASGQQIAAPIANRLLASSGIGALGGGILGGAISSSNDKSLAENIGEGVITGTVGGPLIEGAAMVGKGLARKVVGKISSARSQLAERANQLGIDLKASQVSDSPTLKKYDQISGMLPFSGAQGISQKQINQFTKAVSNTFGKDVEDITPSVISQARKDIGSNIENIYKSATINADVPLQNDLVRIIKEVNDNLSEQEIRPIFNNIRNIVDKIDVSSNTINGDAFNALLKYDGVLSKLQKNSNPNISRYANEIRNSLENALTRSLGPQDKALLNGYRRQYKSAMIVKDMVEGDPEGKVNPLKLMRKVTQAPGGKLGSGELGELADIGREFFINPADSGTPLGSYILNNIAPAIHNPITAGAAAGGALMKGAAFADLGAGALGLAINRGMREAINSKTIREGIIKAGKGSTHTKLDDLAFRVEPYSYFLARQDDTNKPLQITVTPNDKNLKTPNALKKNQ